MLFPPNNLEDIQYTPKFHRLMFIDTEKFLLHIVLKSNIQSTAISTPVLVIHLILTRIQCFASQDLNLYLR